MIHTVQHYPPGAATSGLAVYPPQQQQQQQQQTHLYGPAAFDPPPTYDNVAMAGTAVYPDGFGGQQQNYGKVQ